VHQSRHADRHAFAAETFWDPRDGGGDDIGIVVGVTADLVLAAIDFAAQRGTLNEAYSKPKPKPSSAISLGSGPIDLPFAA
jgi:hypothetical protein